MTTIQNHTMRILYDAESSINKKGICREKLSNLTIAIIRII